MRAAAAIPKKYEFDHSGLSLRTATVFAADLHRRARGVSSRAFINWRGLRTAHGRRARDSIPDRMALWLALDARHLNESRGAADQRAAWNDSFGTTA